jgi:hypothetical protein
MLESAKERAYIYDGKEVRLTGRMAKRPIYDKANPNKFVTNMTIVEIAPKIGSMVSTDPNLLQWVNPRHLFYVIIEEEVTNELIDTIRAENTVDDDQTN